jgi:hypothetical protein
MMQDRITLTSLVVEESHLNWLAPQPNIQDVQAAELKIRLWKVQTRSWKSPAEQPIQYIIYVRSRMQHIITLAPMVGEEPHFNCLDGQDSVFLRECWYC